MDAGTDENKENHAALHSKLHDPMAPPARLELTTFRLGGGPSIQVRYGGTREYYAMNLRACQAGRESLQAQKGSQKGEKRGV